MFKYIVTLILIAFLFGCGQITQQTTNTLDSSLGAVSGFLVDTNSNPMTEALVTLTKVNTQISSIKKQLIF